MIKKYIDFIKESNGYRIPDHFVELNSIGHYLDTLSGEMYPMYADGSFDEDESFDVYDDLDDHDGLSEDDKRLIDSFRISIEELIAEIDALKRSKSWRITAPLRKLFGGNSA